MNDKADYFDITKLFKVMDANGWTEGKNFMKFWADGKAKTASVDPVKKKSIIGANVHKGLRIYTVQWHWLNKFSSATSKYKEFFYRVNSVAVQKLLRHKYGGSYSSSIISSFNDWLVDGLSPNMYLRYIKDHQLQYIAVNPYELNGGKFNDLVASLNGFNFFAFYKGQVINAVAFRADRKNNAAPKKSTAPIPHKANIDRDPLTAIPAKQRKKIELYLKNPLIKNIIYVTHIGIYAGDIYEFNGKQYLATWNIVKNTVGLSKWDYLWGTSDTDDAEDLAITNETFEIYRKKTGKGGDFLALSPIKFTPYSIILPVK